MTRANRVATPKPREASFDIPPVPSESIVASVDLRIMDDDSAGFDPYDTASLYVDKIKNRD